MKWTERIDRAAFSMATFLGRARGAAIGCGLLLILAVGGCLQGCTEPATRPVDSRATVIEVPAEALAWPLLVPKLPIRAAVYYSPDWQSMEKSGWASGDPRVRCRIGVASMALLDQIANALFQGVERLESWPTQGGDSSFEIVLVPRMTDSEKTFFAFDVALDVVMPNGNLLTTVNAHLWYLPETDFSSADARDTPEQVARIRLQQAFATLSTKLLLSSEFDQWLRERNVRWSWPTVGAIPLREDTGVVIALRNRWSTYVATAETAAVGSALRTLSPSINVVMPQAIRAALYPWLSSPDLSDSDLMTALAQPEFARRASQIAVRYLAVADVLESSEDWDGFVGGVGGFGFLGFAWFERTERGAFRVIDLVGATQAGSIDHRRRVPLWAVPAFIIPVPVPVPTPGASMAEAVAGQLLTVIEPRRDGH